MNIAYVTTYNAKSITNWSGLGYHISRSLENKDNNIHYIGELTQNTTPLNFVKKAFYSKVLHKQYPIERTMAAARSYSRQVEKRLSKNSVDFIFSPGTFPIAYLKTEIPKIIYTDATFACMLGYYNGFGNLSAETIRQGHAMEKHALESCALAIYSSDWAAQSAIKDYSINPSKVKVVPFGANFDVDHSLEEMKGYVDGRSKSTLKILLNGVDWKRKGGDLVLATVQELRSRGLDVELHVVGIKQLPPAAILDYVINHGYLSKQVATEEARLKELYKSCHFLFVPSEAEAFGIVFSEASAYGVPSISKATGGIPSAIVNGKNGYALDLRSGVNDYAELILELFVDRQRYNQLALSSYEEFETRLNWSTAGKQIMNLMKAVR